LTKIERIKERTEECTKIDATVQRLLAAQDFSKITTGIRNDAVFVKTLDKAPLRGGRL
jgi:hypothetical protein